MLSLCVIFAFQSDQHRWTRTKLGKLKWEIYLTESFDWIPEISDNKTVRKKPIKGLNLILSIITILDSNSEKFQIKHEFLAKDKYIFKDDFYISFDTDQSKEFIRIHVIGLTVPFYFFMFTCIQYHALYGWMFGIIMSCYLYVCIYSYIKKAHHIAKLFRTTTRCDLFQICCFTSSSIQWY